MWVSRTQSTISCVSSATWASAHYNADHVCRAWPPPLRRGRRPRGLRPATATSASPALPVHPRHPAHDVPRPPLDDAAVRRLRHGRGVERRATATCSPKGVSGLCVAFDLPTQIGYDSDHAAGRRRGRARRRRHRLDRGHGALLDGIPLDRVSTSMTINATAHHPAGPLRGRRATPGRRRRPSSRARSRTTSSRSTSRAAPTSTRRAPSLRLVTDIFAFCERELPQLEHDLDQRLPHPRGGLDGGAGGGLHPRQRHRLRAGGASTRASTSNALGQRLSFFFNAHNDFLEEIAKFRAARRLWARIMRERFGATNPRAQQLRFHTQTAGSTLTAQQPDNNIVRVALQALAAVLGGTQSLHTNCRDEALALPTEDVGAHRAADAADHRRRERGRQHRRPARRLVRDRGADQRDRGGRARAARRGSTRWAARWRPSRRATSSARSRTSAYQAQRRSTPARRSSSASTGSRTDGAARIDVFQRRPEIERQQVERVRAVRAEPRPRRVAGSARPPSSPRRADGDNLVPPIIAAVEARATVGEIADALRRVLRRVPGEHAPGHVVLTSSPLRPDRRPAPPSSSCDGRSRPSTGRSNDVSLRDRARRNARAGRRIGQRQVGDGALDPPPGAAAGPQ